MSLLQKFLSRFIKEREVLPMADSKESTSIHVTGIPLKEWSKLSRVLSLYR